MTTTNTSAGEAIARAREVLHMLRFNGFDNELYRLSVEAAVFREAYNALLPVVDLASATARECEELHRMVATLSEDVGRFKKRAEAAEQTAKAAKESINTLGERYRIEVDRCRLLKMENDATRMNLNAAEAMLTHEQIASYRERAAAEQKRQSLTPPRKS